MRDYAKVTPAFWIGHTGKTFRGDVEAQLLALYLMTSPHSNMIGVYHCPILYMAHEIGIGLEGASKALERLIEAGFCTYEAGSELVFVHRMAAFQISESLKPGDNRVKGVIKDWQNIASSRMKRAFHAIYAAAFHLPELDDFEVETKAPCKPLASQEQEQEQEQEQDIEEPDGSLSTSSCNDVCPPCPQRELIALFGKRLPTLQQPRPDLWRGARADATRARWRWLFATGKAKSADGAMDWFDQFFAYIDESDFLMGRAEPMRGHKPFALTLDWLMKAGNFAKVVEGKYHDKEELAA